MRSCDHDTKNFDSGQIPRAHSNLDILSQTAAVIEESISSAQSSPYASARVTPADYSSHTSPFNDQQSRKTFLALPEITGGSQQEQPHRTIFLEQKKGFLPPPLPFETGSVMVGSGVQIDGSGGDNSLEHSPGIYWTYANGNGSSNTTLMMRGPLSPVSASAEQHPQLLSTMSSGHDTTGRRSTTPTASNSNDTVVHAFLASVNSFSSGSASSAGGNNSTQGFLVAPSTVPVSIMPSQPILQHSQHKPGDNASNATALMSPTGDVDFSSEVFRENILLRQQLAVRDSTVDALQAQVESLQKEIRELRQLPTGKISQIPIEDMLAIMREYGSEVSDTAMPPRKSFVQKASVIRQFRRWNPNFLEWFEFANGSWVPKLGKAGEMRRRHEARRTAAAQRKKKGSGSENDSHNANDGYEDESSNASGHAPGNNLMDSSHTGLSL